MLISSFIVFIPLAVADLGKMNEERIVNKLQELKAKFDDELHSVVKFWFKNSHDLSNGYIDLL